MTERDVTDEVRGILADPTPAPEGEAARLLAYANSHKLPDEGPIGAVNLKWGDLRALVQPLYASPVVPVGVSREEQRPLAEAIYRQVEPLLAECSEPNPEDYIDAIIAALRPTDTGREA
jgi:hypothetical protein